MQTKNHSNKNKNAQGNENRTHFEFLSIGKDKMEAVSLPLKKSDGGRRVAERRKRVIEGEFRDRNAKAKAKGKGLRKLLIRFKIRRKMKLEKININ